MRSIPCDSDVDKKECIDGCPRHPESSEEGADAFGRHRPDTCEVETCEDGENRADVEKEQERHDGVTQHGIHLSVEVLREYPDGHPFGWRNRLNVLEPVETPAVGELTRATRDVCVVVVAEWGRVRIAPVLYVVVGVLLVTVLEMDDVFPNTTLHRDVLDEVDVVLCELFDVSVVCGEFVVVVTGYHRDIDVLARRPELLEEFGVLLFENVELLQPLYFGELPETEGVAVYDEFCVLVGVFKPPQEAKKLVEELYLFELFVSAYVQVAYDVVGSVVRHRDTVACSSNGMTLWRNTRRAEFG